MASKGEETSGKIGKLLKIEFLRGYHQAQEEARVIAEKVKKQHDRYIDDLNLKHKRNLMDLYHLGLEVQTHNSMCRPRQRLNMLQLAVMKGMTKIVTLLIKDLKVDIDEIPDLISTLKQFSGTNIGYNNNSNNISKENSNNTSRRITQNPSTSTRRNKSKLVKAKLKRTINSNTRDDDGINDDHNMKWGTFLANVEKDKIQKVMLSTSSNDNNNKSSHSSNDGSKSWWNAIVDDDFDELFVEQNKTLQMIYTLEGRLKIEEKCSSSGSSSRRNNSNKNSVGYAEVNDGVHNPITTLVPVVSGMTTSGNTFITQATDGLLDINLVVFLLQHGVDIEVDGEGYALQLAQLEMDHVEQTKKALSLGLTQSMTTRSYDFLNNNNSNSSSSRNMILDDITSIYKTRMNLLQQRTENQSERPLFIAIRTGHLEITKLLLEAGADVDAPNAQSLSPLCLACSLHATQIVALLLQCGASVRPNPIQIKTHLSNSNDTNNNNNDNMKNNKSKYHYKNNNNNHSKSSSSSILVNSFQTSSPNVQDPLYCVIAAASCCYNKQSGMEIVKMLLQHGALKYHHTELVKTVIAALIASDTNNNTSTTTTNTNDNGDGNDNSFDHNEFILAMNLNTTTTDVEEQERDIKYNTNNRDFSDATEDKSTLLGYLAQQRFKLGIDDYQDARNRCTKYSRIAVNTTGGSSSSSGSGRSGSSHKGSTEVVEDLNDWFNRLVGNM